MILYYFIVVTALLVVVFGGLLLASAWGLGGEFYIYGNKGRRKNWLERLLDGLEVLRKM